MSHKNSGIIGEDTSLAEVFKILRKVAPTDSTVLVTGESGTGKEVLVRGGAERDSILSDALEAVIGAIYLDSGFTNAKEFILNYVMNDAEAKKLFYDSKTILQEMVQAKGQGKVRYEVIGESGPDHSKCFVVRATSLDGLETVGRGKTKKAAEQEAAYGAILKLRGQED